MQPSNEMTIEQALAQAQALIRSGRTNDAAQLYQQILQVNSQVAPAHGGLALILWEANQFEQAEAHARGALELDPNESSGHCALGLVYHSRSEHRKSVEHLRRAAEIRPDFIVAHSYLGVGYGALGEYDLALAACERALILMPDHPHARFNRALNLLARGNYEHGWLEYEWRWRTGQVNRPEIPRPRWDGSPLHGKGILIHTEQGIGDVLQFIRFLPRVQALGGRVVFACLNELRPLIRRCAGVDEWMPVEVPAAINFDVYSPMLALPGLFRVDDVTLRHPVPYVFPDPERVEKWREPIRSLPGFKVGLCWQGSKTFIGDNLRSIPLTRFAPLASVPGVTLVSLQKGYGSEQIPGCGFAVKVFDDLDATGGIMMDTAAILQHLDLVITSDTAIAHLAGAMGTPCWTAISNSADWRWLRGREDSPWYPSMRLFRQTQYQQWEPVFNAMAEALRRRVAGEPQPAPAALVQAPLTAACSPGELFDKLTILRIKTERIKDEAKRANVRTELAALEAARTAHIVGSAELDGLVAELKAINERLWEIEDDIRHCERGGEFGPKFIELARSVYQTNDERSALKRRINELLGSELLEEKSYASYGNAQTKGVSP